MVIRNIPVYKFNDLDLKPIANGELDFINKTLQVNDSQINSFADSIPTILEAAKNANEKSEHLMNGRYTYIPQYAKNYKLTDAFGQREVFTFKMMLRYTKRQRGTVLDIEIAGKKTMISVRNDFFPTALFGLSEGEVKLSKIKLSKFDFEE